LQSRMRSGWSASKNASSACRTYRRDMIGVVYRRSFFRHGHGTPTIIACTASCTLSSCTPRDTLARALRVGPDLRAHTVWKLHSTEEHSVSTETRVARRDMMTEHYWQASDRRRGTGRRVIRDRRHALIPVLVNRRMGNLRTHTRRRAQGDVRRR
jgi:hypothetical protein